LAFVLADFAVEINNTDDELVTDFEDEFGKNITLIYEDKCPCTRERTSAFS
jgi:hypothetical protein